MKALCTRPEYDPNWWTGVDSNGGTVYPEAYRARSICQACPLRRPCYAQAVENRETGIWGAWRLSEGRVVSHNGNAARTAA
ncbi:MAG: WhiB family transcriptional regulator [Labedaea sp.]